MHEDLRGEGVGPRRHQAPGVRGRPRLLAARGPAGGLEDGPAWPVAAGNAQHRPRSAARGVKLRSLTENADTETPNGKLMFNFLGTIAEYFLDLNRERTMEGLKAALARGRKG